MPLISLVKPVWLVRLPRFDATLQDKDILQVDATLITGILFLFTVSSFAGIGEKPQLIELVFGELLTAIIPLGISALIVVFLNMGTSSSDRAKRYAIFTSLLFMFIGITFLVVTIVQNTFQGIIEEGIRQNSGSR